MWQLHKFIFEPTILTRKSVRGQREICEWRRTKAAEFPLLSSHIHLHFYKRWRKSFSVLLIHLPFAILYLCAQIHLYSKFAWETPFKFIHVVASSYLFPIFVIVVMLNPLKKRQRGFDEYSEFVYGQFRIYPFIHVLITFRSAKIPPA